MKSKESFALTTGLSTREPAGLVLLRASPSGSGCHTKLEKKNTISFTKGYRKDNENKKNNSIKNK